MNSDFWRSRRLVEAEMTTDHIRDEEEYDKYVESILYTNTPVTGGVFAMWENEQMDAVTLPLFVLREDYSEENYRIYAKKLLEKARKQSDKLYFGGAVSADIKREEESMDHFISFFAGLVKILDDVGYDFLYFMDTEHIENGRAAILAAHEVSEKPIVISVLCDEEGKIGNSEMLAALVIFEGLKVAAFGISSKSDPAVVVEQIGEIYPFAKIPLFGKIDGSVGEDWEEDTLISPGIFGAHVKSALENGATHIFMGGNTYEEYRDMARLELSSENRCSIEKRESEIIATCTSGAYFLNPTMEISEAISITEDFAEDILTMENEGYDVLKVHFQAADDFELFVENLYMFNLPICISADNLALYERAAMLYPGRAIYDGTLEFEAQEGFQEVLDKYGIIAL